MTIAGLFNPLDLVKSTNYDINRYQMNVRVQKNGDALVTEKANYAFKGFYHGVYRVFDLNGLDGMTQLKVALKPNHKQVRNIKTSPKYMKVPDTSQGPIDWTKKVQYKNVPAPDSMKENTFEIKDKNKLKQLKLYRIVSTGDKYQVIYKYRLKGFVTNYKDVAVINYKLIPRNWAVPLKHVSLRIKLPGKNIVHLRAWTHGTTYIKTKVNPKTGVVMMTSRKNPKQQFMETHIAMPKTIMSANRKVVDHSQKTAILKQERSLTIHRVGPIISLVGVLLAIALGFQFWVNNWSKKHAGHLSKMVDIPHWFELPNMTPEVAKAVLDRTPSTAISASLIDRIANRTVQLTRDPEDKTSYGLKQIKPFATAENSPDLLTSAEDEFFTLIFTQVQPRQAEIGITKQDIDAYAIDHRQKLIDAKKDWQAGIKRLADKYLDQDNISLIKRNSQAFWINMLLIFIASAVACRLNNWWFAALCWALALLVGGYSYMCRKKAKKGIEPYNEEHLQEVSELKGFVNMLRDFQTFKDSWPDDVILWERYLAFATAFGCAQNVTEAFQINFSDEEVVESPLFLASYDGSFDFSDSWSSFDSVGDASSSFGGGGAGGGGAF